MFVWKVSGSMGTTMMGNSYLGIVYLNPQILSYRPSVPAVTESVTLLSGLKKYVKELAWPNKERADHLNESCLSVCSEQLQDCAQRLDIGETSTLLSRLNVHFQLKMKVIICGLYYFNQKTVHFLITITCIQII